MEIMIVKNSDVLLLYVFVVYIGLKSQPFDIEGSWLIYSVVILLLSSQLDKVYKVIVSPIICEVRPLRS